MWIYKLRRPHRLRLRKWVEFENLRRRMEDRMGSGDWRDIPSMIRHSIRLCGAVTWKEPWYYTVSAYIECLNLNNPRKEFPMLETKGKPKKMPWEYDGRTWYFWVNLLASHYGWTEKVIGDLDLDDAIGLYQEILVAEQMEQEFQWALSETSWEYIKSSGKSKLRPLPRPDWMSKYDPKDRKPVVIKTKIPLKAMPVGNIVDIGST